MNILAVGDICGRTGLAFLSKKLRALKRFYGADFTVVNGENASVLGIKPSEADEIFDAGADVITLGNHTWSRHEIIPYLDETRAILRPANFPMQNPGYGWGVYPTDFGDVAVVSLIGRCQMDFGNDSPFQEIGPILSVLDNQGVKIRLVDFHAEATSEKLAMAYYLDGDVSAVWGTHTHVQTSDARVTPKGTGCVTDLGMTGAVDSVLGIKPEQSVSRFLGNPPIRYTDAGGPAKIEGAVFTLDPETGRCLEVAAIRITD